MIDPSDLIPTPDVEGAVRDALAEKLVEAYEEHFGEQPQERLDRYLKDHGFVVDEGPNADYKARDGDPKVRYVLGEQYETTLEDLVGQFGSDIADLPGDLKNAKIAVKEIVVEVDPSKHAVEVNAVKLEIEGRLFGLDLLDVEWRLGALGAKVSLDPYTFVPLGPYAARLFDVMSHGGVVGPGPGSPDVFIGGRPALRAGDTHACPAATPLAHGSSAFVPTQHKVRINGRPALRQGDYIVEPTGGPNVIVGGCPTVFIGPAPLPVDTYDVVVGEQRYILELDLGAVLDFGFLRGKANAGAKLDPKGKLGVKLGAEGDIAAARLTLEPKAKVTIPLGDLIDLDVPWIGRIHPGDMTSEAKAKVELLGATCGGKAGYETDKGRETKGFGDKPKGCTWARPGEVKVEAAHRIETDDEDDR